jgi:ribokinase
METLKITVVGSSNTDLVVRSERLPSPGETILGGTFFMNQGGKGANQAVAAARLGGQVTFISKTGIDVFGKQSVQIMKEEGINTRFVFTDPVQPSGIALIMVDDHAENCIAVAPGANSTLQEADIDKAMKQIENSDIILLQLEIPMHTVEYVAKKAASFNKTVILNPAPAQKLSGELLKCISVITPNETEAELLTGIKVSGPESAAKAAKILKDKGISTVIITMGSAGAFVLTDSLSKIVPVEKVTPIDTTAAGDTFNGALAVALSEGKKTEEAIVFANKAASISVTRLGAQSSAPYRKEIIDQG